MTTAANTNRGTSRCLGAIGPLAVTLAVGLLAAPQRQKIVVFPGKVSTSASPNHHYVLVNTDDERLVPPHRLYLLHSKSQTRVLLLGYPRWVGTLWSPKGNAVAVNDHAESDNSDCYVFLLSKPIKKMSIRRILHKEFPGDPTLFFNDHVYLDAVEWISADRLKIKAYGHGPQNPNGFVEFYEYRLGGRIKAFTHAHF